MKKKDAKPQRKPKADDLTADELFAIKQLITSDGWLALQKVLKKNIRYLERQIIDDDELSGEVRLTQRDLARQWLKYNKRLAMLPETLTAHHEEDDEVSPTRLDPYPRTLAELRAMVEPKA